MEISTISRIVMHFERAFKCQGTESSYDVQANADIQRTVGSLLHTDGSPNLLNSLLLLLNCQSYAKRIKDLQSRTATKQAVPYTVLYLYTYGWETYMHAHGSKSRKTLGWDYYSGCHTMTAVFVACFQSSWRSFQYTPPWRRHAPLRWGSSWSLMRTSNARLWRMIWKAWGFLIAA